MKVATLGLDSTVHSHPDAEDLFRDLDLHVPLDRVWQDRRQPLASCAW